MSGLVVGRWQVSLVLLVSSFIGLDYAAPVINTTQNAYNSVTGGSAYLECSVTGLQTGQTVSWKFVDHEVTISAGNNITVAHPDKYEIVKPQIDQGSQSYWNLRIYDLEPEDGGSYTCMVDGTNVGVTHTLTITDAPPPQPVKPLNETDCCIRNGVASCALPLCDMNSAQDKLIQILSAPGDCIGNNLLKILECGGDGRNHMGCCMRRGITEYCSPLCNYVIMDPALLERNYEQCIAQGLLVVQCLTEGQANLPSQPTFVSAISMGNSVYLTWRPPRENADIVTGYKIQYKLKSDSSFQTSAKQKGLVKTVLDLAVDVVYEVRVIAVSDYGASAPSETVEVATKSPISKSQRNETIQTCCRKSVDVSDACIEFCHADALDTGLHPDRVLPCFGELDGIFTCLLGADVTPCCNRTQVPEECLDLCAGKSSVVTLSEIQCMMYLPLISACAIEGAHFLPSPPENTHILPGSITSNSAIVEWDPPQDNSTQSYRVAWKPYEESDNVYHSVTVESANRYVLTGLKESTLYKVLVVSENDIGSSLPQLSLLFVTEGVSSSVTPEPFNETACCSSKGVPDSCLSICNHTFRLSDAIFNKGLSCINYLMHMMICATDGRDHSYCCKQSGLPDACLKLCKLTPTDSVNPYEPDLYACILEKDTMSKCFDEGKMVLPKMPTQVTVMEQDVHFLLLIWNAPTGPNVTSYIVEYSSSSQAWTQVTTSQTFLKLTNLQPATRYWLRVYSVSQNYTSLPASIISYTLPMPLQSNVTIDWTQVWQNRSHCCDNQGLQESCLEACKKGAKPQDECLADLDKIIQCGADGRDHTSCCQYLPDFPDECLPYCRGQSPSSRASQFCPPYFSIIMTCISNGQDKLPTPPQNFSVTGYTNKNITVTWDPPAENCYQNCSYIAAIWKQSSQNYSRQYVVTPGYTFVNLTPETKYRVVALAMNKYGSSLPSTSILVVTRANPYVDITVSSNPNGLIDQDTAVELRCVARTLLIDVTKVQWKRNNIVLTEATFYNLPAVGKKDAGRYTCAVTYENGKVHTKDLWLNIIYQPEAVKIHEETVSPGINADAYLKCYFQGFPSIVSWKKDGQEVTNIEKYYVWPQKPDFETGLTLSVLAVQNVVHEDYGNYTCVGSNKFGRSDGLTGQLTNLYPTLPPLPTVAPNTSVNECCQKENVSTDCLDLCTFSVDITLVNTKPHCLWFLEEYIYCGSDHRDHTDCCTGKGIQEVCLPICKGTVPDLDNTPNIDQCLANIKDIMWCAENGQRFIPTQPQNVVTEMQYDQMVVTWSPPAENAEKVNFYAIYYQSNEDKIILRDQAGPSKTSHAISGLKKGATYQVWMLAANDYGQSHKTNKTELLVSSLTPRKPENLNANIVEGINIRVRWSPPQSSIVVAEYWVFYKQNNPSASYVSVTTTETSMRLEMLKPSTEYMIYVIAHSQDGGGEQSAVINITTGEPKTVYAPTAAPQTGSSEKTVGLAIGLVLALVLLVAVTVISVFLYRRMGSGKTVITNSTVAFENPHYGEQSTGVKITGLPGISQADKQFGYSTLEEEMDTEPKKNDIETTRHSTDEHEHTYDNSLAQRSGDPATLDVGH